MMCSGSVKVPGSTSKVIFSLLFFSSALGGLRAINVDHLQTAEAAVGQNVSLPCILNDSTPLSISQLQWSRKGSNKLVVHHHQQGTHYFTTNVGFLVQTDDQNKLKGSFLQLYDAQVNDSGTYVCELSTYPLGSVYKEMRLNVQESTSQNTAVSVSTRETALSTTGPAPTRQSTPTGPWATTWGSEPSSGATHATAGATEEDRTTDEVTPRSTASEQETPTQGGLTESTADPTSSHLTTADSASSHLTTTDPASSHLTTTDPASSHLTTADPASSHLTTADPASSHVTTADQMVSAGESAGTGARLWWLAVVMCVAVCVALGVLYRRRARQMRADLPPPFKPPPPPRKYTSMRPHLVPACSECA